MQITYHTAKRIYNVCVNLGQKQLPFRVAYKFAKLKELLDKEMPIFSQEEARIIIECSKKDDEGKTVLSDDGDPIIDEEKLGECLSSMSELDKTNLILEDIKFNLNELENCSFSVDELQCLLPLIRNE